MRKILVVAGAELGSIVRSKAFLLGVLLMPVLIGGMGLLQKTLEDRADTTPKKFAVIDPAGTLYPVLAARAGERNRAFESGDRRARGARFEPRLEPGAPADPLRLELSERVRKEELFAFVEIDADRIRYFSDHPAYDELRKWLDGTLNDELRRRRYRAAGLDEKLVADLEREVPSEHLGLFARAPDGTLVQAERVDRFKSEALPLLLMFLLFMLVMGSVPQLVHTVIEEKMSRVSEVLLGSVTPFQLMMGKLLGRAGVSMLLALIYAGGGFAAAMRAGVAGAIPLSAVLCFVLFLGLAVFLFGAVFIAIGAACSDLKDAQSLMTPVIMILMMPAFTYTTIVASPNSAFATAVSLFPPATPFLMLLRMTLHPSPPLWQVLLSIALTAATTVGCIWAAGKIFRVGLLSQGKSPSLLQLLRWVFAR